MGANRFHALHGPSVLGYRLERSAYCPSDKITVNVELRNDSAVDVTGFTVKVNSSTFSGPLPSPLCMHMYTHPHTYTHMHMYTHTYTHAHTHTHTHTYTHTHTHAHTCTHTYTHAHTQLIRVIKLHGLDRSRGEEERTARTVLDTVLETDHNGCNKNNSTNWSKY